VGSDVKALPGYFAVHPNPHTEPRTQLSAMPDALEVYDALEMPDAQRCPMLRNAVKLRNAA